MKKYFEILKKVPLFSNINDDDLLKMLACLGAKVKTYNKKHTIIPSGNPAKYIGIVLSGCAQTIQVDYFGNRSILNNIEPAEIFGEAFACSETASIPISVVANENSEVMLIECSRILHTCSSNCSFHQQLIFNLMKDLATKIISFYQKIEITSKRSTRDKLITYLMFQLEKSGSNSIYIPFNRQELADYLGIDRSGLSAEISKLKDEGIINCHKNHFELL